MKMNSSKSMFLTLIFLSTLTSLNSMNWMTMWTTLEINMFMFLPMMSKKKMKDQPMKYFIIQSISSSMIMLAILINSINQTLMSESTMLMVSMILKMGMSPMHMWVPSIMLKMSWENCLILVSIMKIPPMNMCSQMITLKMMIMPMIMSMMIGSITGLKQTSLKKMMAYSSITNSTWMLSSFLIKKNSSILFMIIYTTINSMIMMNLKKNKMMYLNQMNSKPMKLKLDLILNMLSLSGLPPTIGFFNKWLILKEMIKQSISLTLMMILTSTISMYFYLRMTSMFMLKSSSTKKNLNKNLISSFLMLNCLGLPMMFLMKTM